MKNAWNWLVQSSADPNKLALTVKGFLGTVVSIVILTSPLLHLKVGSDQLNTIVDSIIQIVVILATIISSVATLIGVIRKVYITIEGW